MRTRNGIIRKLRRQPLVIDAHTHVGTDPVNYTRGDFPYGISAEDMTLRMATQGIDAAVCFPMLYTTYFRFAAFCTGRFVRDPGGPSTFPYEAENRTLCREIYEAFPACAGTLLPFAFFDPARRQQEQAAGLRELAAQYPLFGLKTATSYLQSPITALLGRGSCLLDLASDLGVPVTIHTSVLPGDPWGDVFEILKVVKARPDVRFALAHTCRFDLRALDTAAELPNAFVDVSAFHIHCTLARRNSPAVAAKGHRFPADYRRHAVALQKIAAAYPDTILWGTDCPYHLFKGRFFDEKGKERVMDLPCEPMTEITEFRKLPRPLQKRIAYTNTLRWLTDEA
jgi:predicted TIM-barrel fold metal-dependent hydrolase